MKLKLYFLKVILFISVTAFSQSATHLNFDGVDDTVALTHFQRPNEFTVEAFVKSSSSVQNTIMGWGTNAATYTSEFKMVGGQLVYAEFDQVAGIYQTVATSTLINDNNWHHVAVTRTNTPTNNILLYIDGALSATGTVTINTVTTELTIGAFNFGGNQQFFNGSIDEVRIWNNIRTANQINGSKNCELQGTESGLVRYYKFNQGVASGTNTSITSVTDASASASNGTLSSFALTGTTSNFLATSPVITGSIVPSNATVTTPVVYTQGATATALTATTGANGTGLLWYTVATGGTGSTTAPTPSTATAGNTSYWVSSTNANGCESARMQIVVTVNVPATHLNFDGSNDYVELPNESNFDFTNQMSVEFWMNSNVTNPEQWDALVVKGDDSWRVHLNATGTVYFTCSAGASTLNAISTTIVTDGNWHHIAATLGGNSAKIYIDGVLENQVAVPGILNNSTYPVLIGNNPMFGPRYYTGNLDDVRIWNTTRTAEQINGSKNCELQATETGLVAYYKFNQGFDAANNSTFTTLTDATANANNGTLTNFTLTASTSNWLAGSPVTTGSIVPSNATVTTPVTYNQGATATALTATTGANGTGLLWYTAVTGGTGSTMAPTPSTATAGNTSYWVTSSNANGCESTRTEIVVRVNGPGTHLNFDGFDDKVELSNESNFDFTSTFTMECWIRVSSFTQDWQSVITKGALGPRINRYANTNFISFGTGPQDDLISTVSVNDGNWHHIAAVCNNGVKTLYVDGVSQGTQAVGLPLATNNDNVRIGSQIDSYSPIRAFHGNIDEVRIWNVALSATDITNTMNCELLTPTSQPGLVAYYQFNEGFDGVDNTGITSLNDVSVNSNTGTLTNFALAGTTSNWLAGSPITTGNTCTTLSSNTFDISSNINLYPNPTSTIVNVTTKNLTNVSVTVNDINGRVMMSKKLSTSSNSIDISSLQTGMYLFTIQSQEGETVKKIIKN